MTLPLLISVPHAGLSVPDWLRDRCLLTLEEIVQDGDEGAAEIYAIEALVQEFVTTDVARAVVDMNRAEDDLRKDGVVKTHTCFDVPIWKEPLDASSVERLLREHHRPYHRRLSEAPASALLGVDCHTMCAVGPPVGPDAGVPRPRVCLSNAHGTLPDEWFERLFDCFRAEFGDDVRKNDPFSGGYITRHHSAERPWVQVELSRAPFASNRDKRDMVVRALTAFCASLAGRA